MRSIAAALALALGLAVAAPPAFAADPVATPSGAFVDLGRNDRGYREFRRERDGAVMVLVPGGVFRKRTYSRDIVGDGDPRPLEVDAFLVDRTEVTNARVAAFLAAAPGVTLREGRAMGADGAVLAVDHPFGLVIRPDGVAPAEGFADHPAVGATGRLALAYARHVGGDLPRGYEWEKAAAGPRGLLYPWGDDRPDPTRANSFLGGPRRPRPVGSLPAGASPYGLLDMAGNVYERCYGFESPEEVATGAAPVMLRGGAWVSPHPSNLRCVDRCAQGMDAADGSVGFRVLVRDPETVRILAGSGGPRLEIHDDVEAAFAEAAARNVPVLLFLAYDTCGQCDRTRAQVFSDPRFVEYVNERVVLLAGHDPGDGWPDPTEPAEGDSILYPGCRTEELRKVFARFVRDPSATWVPESIRRFRVSPGIFALDPHRDRHEAPEDLVLVPESAFPKGGDGVPTFLERLRRAQERLGTGTTRTQWRTNRPR